MGAVQSIADASSNDSLAPAGNASAAPAKLTTKPRNARYRTHSNAGRLTVVSDLTSSEPVTEAEIALVLAVLGGSIATILGLDPTSCPTFKPTDAA